MKIVKQYEEVLLQKATKGYREFRIPGILAVKDALLLTFEARGDLPAVGGGDWGDIDVVILRKEEGKEPVEVFKYGESHLPKDGSVRTYNNPVLIPDEGKVHLIFHKNYDNVYIVTSEDDGKTWTEPREITDDYRKFPWDWTVSATGPGHGIRTKSGRLIAPIWIAQGELREDGTRQHHPAAAGSVYSDDHGLTWNAGALVPAVTDANETCVAELEDGRVLFNHRNGNAKMLRVLSVSSNGGETLERIWAPEELVDPRCFAAMASCKGGVLFVNCNSVEKRVDLTVKFSADGGKTWEVVWEVDEMAGYPDIAVVDDEVYLFYERTDYTDRGIKEIVLTKGKIVSE